MFVHKDFKKLWLVKENNSRIIFKKYEVKKIVLKSLLYNDTFSFYKKFFFDFLFKKITYKSSISRYRSTCSLLMNTKSIIRPFNLSRHICRKYASHGLLAGMRKSSF